ncbi:I78 family peptidase inhibitor [Pseudooceanicola onchidii]|uniref:I78 family peptidase inhibitor n=1 Tax=Pseudooceanicola onchidii TaxID=2562279 RepID=UPI0010A9E988|nr:I78 family peptidase inhibitor [Pseudooceanicola onchidii]
MRGAVVLCAALALAGCRETGVTEVADDPCGATQYQSLVGQDRAAIAAAGLEAGRDLRILGPDDMATMDYRADRLNIDLDDAGVVTRLRCG